MTTTNQRNWNMLMLIVLVSGLVFIWMSRVGSTTGVRGPQQNAGLDQPAAPVVGRIAPAFSLSTPDGRVVQLAELRGQVVLINVWATWCPPCRAEMPAIEAAYSRYGPEGFTVLAVNVAEDPAKVAAYMQATGLSFPALLDHDAAVANRYQVRAMPSSFFVDRRGVIRIIYRGPMSQQVITGAVEQLLAEP
ncbi:MAG: TlpA family protein disulfide reductase [Candidatus Viridilinea halotolerans]|uniref:TlpA family protein disulfide reductase n=1 Tax=Candidatus Viridilinea halotolerans TaxID=2491704 RepID=A0A426U107_9CHLR|nr:MAG: TlpA family protein disulfide reductase [Candidatus Viridilinea halotolerans]